LGGDCKFVVGLVVGQFDQAAKQYESSSQNIRMPTCVLFEQQPCVR
jgi:hypothetical protein